MKRAALLSMIVVAALCLTGFGPGEVTGDRHPADSYTTHSGSQGPWARFSARDSFMAVKRIPGGGFGGIELGKIGMGGSNGLRNLGPSTVGNWDMHPADEYERSCRYGQCAIETVKPAGTSSQDNGTENGRDKFLKKNKREQLGFGNSSDPRTDKDEYASRPSREKDDDGNAKNSEKNKKGKNNSGLGLSAMDKIGPHITYNTPHPADSYDTSPKEFREPMKMIDPGKLPYRIYKSFSNGNSYEISRKNIDKEDGNDVSSSDDEKSFMESLRKKTWKIGN